MDVTKHANKRARQRLGVPKKAVDRLAEKALEVGARHSDFAGSFRRYLDKTYLAQEKATNMRVYKDNLFIFAGDTLITMWPVPPKHRSAARRAALSENDRE